MYCVCTCIDTWSETTLICDPLQDLCPGDNEQRVCTCVITSAGSSNAALNIHTNRSDVFSHPGVTFFPSSSVKTNKTAMGFTVILTNNTVGSLTANLIFTPDAVSTTEVMNYTCENPNVSSSSRSTILAVTYAGTHTIILLWC